MTPFAKLGLMEKSAYQGQAPPAGYEYQVNERSGLRDPYAAYRPQAGTAAALREQPRWGVVDNTVGDIALSSIPFVGSAYLGNKAVQDFRRGNVWAGIGNGVMAGLSLIPGVGLAKGVASAAGKGVMGAIRGGARGAMTTGGLGVKTTLGAGIGAGGLSMVPDKSAPVNPNAYNTPTTPMGDLQRTMTSAVVNNGMPPATP
jgi:hypothetical protein